MKRLFLLLLIALAVGAWVGEKMVQDPGYVLLSYNETTIETSLWVLLLATFVGFLLLHWAVNLFFNVRLPTGRFRAWRSRRQVNVAQSKTLKGLLALSEGKWWQAQRLLTQSADTSGQPLVNYLAAARAAHEQREDKAADELLQKARHAVPQAELAIGMTQVQIQLERNQLEPCLATLLRLRRLAPKHAHVLRQLKEVYVRLQDWQGLTSLLPDLRKHKALPEAELSALEQTCYAELLGSVTRQLPVESDDATRLKTLTKEWQALPNSAKNDTMVEHYINLLLEQGSVAQAETFLREHLKKQWSEPLAALYGRINSEDAHKQLDTAKGWLKKHADSAALRLTLARLAMRNEQWGKAVEYLEESIELEKSADAYQELIRLLQHLGETERAAQVAAESSAFSGIALAPLPAAKGSAETA